MADRMIDDAKSGSDVLCDDDKSRLARDSVRESDPACPCENPTADADPPNADSDAASPPDDWNDDDFYAAPTVEYDSDSVTGAENRQFALLFALFSPGSGSALFRHPIAGVLENFAVIFLLVALLVVSMLLALFPLGFVVIWFAVLLGVWGVNVMKIFSERSRQLRRASPFGGFLLAVASFWAPLVAAFYVCSTHVVQRTWMTNDTMNPTIKKGDALLVDKLAFARVEPKYGDVVLVEDTISNKGITRHRAFFGRIIACPGDTVQLIGVHPYVNDKPLSQAVVMPRDPNARPSVAYEIPFDISWNAVADDEPGRWYPVQLPSKSLFSQTNALTLDGEFYYVLEDNRDTFNDRIRNSYGAIVHRSEIKGKPVFILYNTESDDTWRRFKLGVR